MNCVRDNIADSPLLIIKIEVLHMAYVAVRGAELFSVKLPEASQHNFILSEERFDLSRPCDQIIEFASAGPSSRCASTIQMIRLSRSTPEMQPQLNPALLRLSATISQYLTRCFVRLPLFAGQSQKWEHRHQKSVGQKIRNPR